jgi:hypothetical protein
MAAASLRWRGEEGGGEDDGSLGVPLALMARAPASVSWLGGQSMTWLLLSLLLSDDHLLGS